MGKVTYQHKAVAEIAIVTDAQGKVWLKANRKPSTDCYLRWIERKCDFVREFTSVQAALATGLKVCPIFHGTIGPVPQIQAAQFVYGIGYCSSNFED